MEFNIIHSLLWHKVREALGAQIYI